MIDMNLNRLKDLPTLPIILKRLFEVLQDEQSTFVDIADIIKNDQILSEKILSVANSPYFGHTGKVNTIQQAVMLLGYDLVKGISLGTSVFRFLGKRECASLGRLWQHSYEVGIIAANISDHICNLERSVCFVTGLLHDIGRVVFLSLNREEYLSMLSADDITVRETETFGIDHAKIGAVFLENALLPEEIVCSVRYHHHPSECTVYRETSSVTSLAEALSRSFFPKIEDDGLWTKEHNAILLEFAIDQYTVKRIKEKAMEEAASIQELFSP